METRRTAGSRFPRLAHFTRFIVALTVVPWLSFVGPLAADQEVQVQVNLHYQGDRDFTYVQLVDRSEGSSFESDAQRAIRPYLEEARKKLAIKEGYQPEIYGDNYYQMVQFDRFRYRVTESASGRLIVESEDGKP